MDADKVARIEQAARIAARCPAGADEATRFRARAASDLLWSIATYKARTRRNEPVLLLPEKITKRWVKLCRLTTHPARLDDPCASLSSVTPGTHLPAGDRTKPTTA